MDERLASMSPDELRGAMRSLGYRTLFVVGATLFVMTFVANLVSHRLSRRVREGR